MQQYLCELYVCLCHRYVNSLDNMTSTVVRLTNTFFSLLFDSIKSVIYTHILVR